LTEPDAVEELRRKVATACRILAHQGLVREIIGHVSARVPGAGEMLLRCRGADEYGLHATSASQVRRLNFDGTGPGLGDDHVRPIELPIHGEMYRARPDVGAVVHAHPYYTLLCGLAGIELRPITGAYDPGALAVAMAGVTTYPRSVLIDSPERAVELLAAMHGHDTCIMTGHGITVVGATIEQATIRAINLEVLARIHWDLHSAGIQPQPIAPEDLATFLARTAGGSVIPGGDAWTWRSYERLLEASGDA
jgi:ribulose-5-phosphate 4-epimerase/fuculose-1-phosphate aldolase